MFCSGALFERLSFQCRDASLQIRYHSADRASYFPANTSLADAWAIS